MPRETRVTDTVERAVEAARQMFSPHVWFSKRPEERTSAIYEEIRRLDAEAIALAANQKGIAPQPRKSRQVPPS